MPSVVDKDRLSQANGRLYAVELTMNQFVGPPIGGILAGAAIGFAFGGSALAFAIAAVFLALLTGSFRPAPRTEQTSVVADIREGLRYLFDHRLLRTLAIMVGTMNLATSAAFAIFVLYAVGPGPMGLDALGYGVLTTTLAIGSLIGSLVVERVEARLGRARLLMLTVVLCAVTLVVPGLTTNAWLIGTAFAVMGLGIVMWNVVTVSLRQRIVPDALLGRVNASYRLLAWGTQPIGAVLGGLIAEAFGLRAVFLFSGAITVLLLFARAVISDATIAAAEREGAEEAERLMTTGAPAGAAPP
jgi:predicted MFS family arabinose efflux permease